jgi:hypothetical protein
MTEKGSSWPLCRPGSRAQRAAIFVLTVVIGLPVWVAIMATITLLALLCPVLTLLTGGVFVCGIAVATYFAMASLIGEAIRAAFLAIISGACLLGITGLSERLGFENRPTYPVPPWWWSV